MSAPVAAKIRRPSNPSIAISVLATDLCAGVTAPDLKLGTSAGKMGTSAAKMGDASRFAPVLACLRLHK